MSDTTDPNRLGPVTREWVAALERRIEQLERLTNMMIAIRQGEEDIKDGRVCYRSELAGMARPVTEGDGLTAQSTESPSHAGVGEAPETVTSSATPPEIEWWDERDLLLGDLQNARREIDRLRAQLADDRGCPCKLADRPCSTGCTCVNPMSSIGCERCCRYGSLEQRKAAANRIAAQLAARPVVTATDEQIEELSMNLRESFHPLAFAHAVRSWLSTIGVASVKQVEAWVAGDRVPKKGEQCVTTATWDHGCNSAYRVLNRVTLNVVQEPNNE